MKLNKLLKKVDDIVKNIDTDYLLKKLEEKDESDYELYFEDNEEKKQNEFRGRYKKM